MEGYDIGKDRVVVNNRIEELTALMEQVYRIVDYNVKKGTLEEPKPTKK